MDRTEFGVRLPVARSGQVSSAFVHLLRKYGASPQLLRNIEMITEDQLYTQPQPLREALAESVELTRLLNRRVADLEAHVMRLQAENDYLVVQLDKAVRQVEEAVRQAETYRSGMA